MLIVIEDEEQYIELFTTIYVMAATENPKLLLAPKEFEKTLVKQKPSGYPALFIINDENSGTPTLAEITIISESDLKAKLMP